MTLFLNVPTIFPDGKQQHVAVDLRDMVGGDVTGFSGYTVVTKIRRIENLLSGTSYRIVLEAPVSADGSVSAVYVGEAATSGNAYDFSATPTQVTFGGSTSLTLAKKKTFVSDPIALDFNPAKAHVIAMNVSSSTLRRFTTPEDTTRGVVSFYRAATSEAGTAAKTAGYTAQGNTSYGLTLVKAIKNPPAEAGLETAGDEEQM